MIRLQLLGLCLLSILVIGHRALGADEEPYDLLIQGGRVIDGSGVPWFQGDIAVRGDRIVAIGRSLPTQARKVIRADQRVVCPGFIDIHSHSDFLLFEDGDAPSKIRQGVTTEVLGEGESAGPFLGKLPPHAEVVHGKSVTWSTLGGYFDALESAGVSVNVASYVGLNNIWRCVMGERFDRPTEQELAEMKQLVAAAMQQGARGLSSQVMMPPGSIVTTDEVVQLCQVVAQHAGIYSTHIRNEGTDVFASVKEAIEVAERAHLPVDVIHLKIADQQLWGRMNEVVALIEEARQRGLNVQANVYPYTRGNNNLVSIIPPWAHEGGTSKLLERLRDPATRARLKHEIHDGVPGWYNHLTAVGEDWSRILISGDNRFKGLTMDRVFALRQQGQPTKDPLDELFDLLLEEEGSVGAVYAHHREDDMLTALRQPWCSVGSDGSAYAIDGPLRRGSPHPRNFGTFPRVLGLYVRQQHVLGWEEAVRKMTWQNAVKVGLRDRGLLAPGYFADLVILDPATIVDHSTYEDPFQYNDGIETVIVNGQVVFQDGTPTHVRSGRMLRH